MNPRFVFVFIIIMSLILCPMKDGPPPNDLQFAVLYEPIPLDRPRLRFPSLGTHSIALTYYRLYALRITWPAQVPFFRLMPTRIFRPIARSVVLSVPDGEILTQGVRNLKTEFEVFLKLGYLVGMIKHFQRSGEIGKMLHRSDWSLH